MNSLPLPRPEYPRPQFARDRWMNLNGEWQFVRDPSVSGKERKLYEAASLPDRITVPFCMESVLSGIGDTDFCNCVWYRREIELDESWLSEGKRVILNAGISKVVVRDTKTEYRIIDTQEWIENDDSLSGQFGY